MGIGLALCLASLPEATPQQTGAAPAPSQPADRLDEARRLVTNSSFPHAEVLLRSYLGANPDSAAAHKLLAYCLLRENRPKEALPEYTRAAQIEPPTGEDLKNVAQAYALLGDYVDATRWSRLSVERDPADPDAWYSLGRIDYTELRFAEAVGHFHKALTLAPRSVKAENNLGLALEGLNRTDEAIAAYRQAIAWGDAAPKTPSMEQPLLNLAIALIHKGQSGDALPLLTRAAAIAPQNPRIHEQLGQVYLEQTSLPAAASELEEAIALDPSSGALHFLLGQVYRRQGADEKARLEFARAAAIMGTHSNKN